LAAAAWHFAIHSLRLPSAPWIVLGCLGYLAAAAAGILWLRRIFQRFGPARFLWAALLSSLAIQSAVIGLSDRNWQWTNDARIFQHYLDRLSQDGYSPEVLGELSTQYDYRVWTRRAQPFYLALRQIAGDHFVRAIQFFQAGLVALSLLLTWRLARLVFGIRTAFWATTLQWLMPFRWIASLDLNHHLLGGFYFLAGLVLLAEWLHGKPSAGCRWALAAAAAVLVPLMRLEGGVDLVYLASAALVLVLHTAARPRTWRTGLPALLALVAVPAVLSSVLLLPLARRIDQGDLHRHESGPIAFMARGWSPETGGEYCFTYEQIDYLTPADRKKPVMVSVLASQAFYNPGTVLFRLMPVKTAKYFLLGYAAGAEEMLNANGAHRAKALANGARAAFLLAALPLMIAGGVLLFPLLRRPRRMALVLPCALICGTFVFLGETSPRYSIYIQPFLFMLAALPLAWPASRRIRLARAAGPGMLTAAVSLALALAAAAGVLHVCRPALQRHAFLDLREWSLPPSAPAAPLPATLAPLEIELLPVKFGDGTAWPVIDLPEAPAHAGHLTFYLFPQGVDSATARQTAIVTEYRDGPATRTQTNSLPARIRLPYSAGTRGSLAFRTSRPFPHPLRLGYAAYERDEKTTE
jgi:hypothetical protein